MLNGLIFKNAVISGGVNLANHKKEIDELNIYPVPDGDTGTNMSMTMDNALKELSLTDDDITVSRVAEIVASAMLRGARGNSGVILSLIFGGISKSLAMLETASCADLANALELGVNMAYKAVMNPTEGTILTVARMSALKAQEICKTTNDISLFWQDMCIEAEKTLNSTPKLLPVLKKAGVVDAGGMGLLTIFNGMLRVFKGQPPFKPLETVKTAPSADVFSEYDDEDINFTYCTEFLINKSPDSKDPISLKAYLQTIGDCVIVADDDDIIKVHVHTNDPGLALQKALEYGFINLPKIENMRMQHDGKVKEQKLKKNNRAVPVKPEKKYGFVAVGAGRGIEAMFKDLGADIVVKGGQTMNPSTNDILDAIHLTPAETVFVMPNNKNIIMAAEQAISLADRNVCVLQTRTIPQGIAAMLAFDEDADISVNRDIMTQAFERVSTGLITFAARNSEYENYSIKKGEILAFDNTRLSFTDNDITKSVLKLIRRLIKSDTSYITIIYGADVTEDDANRAYNLVRQKISDKIEIMLVNGGQPVYYYIISVE